MALLPVFGIATADAFYAAVTAFGLALISDFLLARQWFFRLFGGLALIAVGLRIVFAAPPEVTTKPENESYLADYTTMLAITLANPLTILFFHHHYPGLRRGDQRKYAGSPPPSLWQECSSEKWDGGSSSAERWVPCEVT